jgi:glycosyltransferase involved in cell wall biosynthesis
LSPAVSTREEPNVPEAVECRQVHGVYVARLDLLLPHLLGVAAKVRAQADALRALPGTIAILHPSNGEIRSDGSTLKRYGKGGLWRRLVHYWFFYEMAAVQARDSDFIYLRYQGASPSLVRLLRRVRRENPSIAIFVEIPTYPYDFAVATVRARVLLAVDKAWRRKAFALVDRIVTFSRHGRIFGVPTIQTDNGVDVDAFPLSRSPSRTGPLRLAGVANVSYWHGYDRVIAGMANYFRNGGARDVHFDIIGDGHDLQQLKDLAASEGLGDRVHFHGARRGQELSDILARCHVGISCIALHRKGSDTSDLKSREYCARGLPFVIGYHDRDFPADFPFAHQVSTDDAPVDIGQVEGFYHRLQANRPGYPEEMREFAERHLTWKVKMQPVLDALRDHVHGAGA